MTAFETEPCSRCGGTGEYSFNGEHSRCYKCDGKNGARALTARGKAAKEYYLAKFNVPASAIKVGDVIKGNLYKFRVTKISQRDGLVVLSGASFALHTGPEAIVRRFPTEEENAAAIADALAYQETLTKAGEPRKIRA